MDKIKKTLLTLTLILSAFSLSACDEVKKPEDKPAIEDTGQEDDNKTDEEETPEENGEDKEEPEDEDSEDKEDQDEKPIEEEDQDDKTSEGEEKNDGEDQNTEEKPENDKPAENKLSFNKNKTEEYKKEIKSIGGPNLYIIQDDNSEGNKTVDFSKVQAVAKFENKDLTGWVIRYDNSKIGIATHHKKAVDPIVNLWSQESLIEMSQGQFTGMKNDEASEYKNVSLGLIESLYKDYENKVSFAY